MYARLTVGRTTCAHMPEMGIRNQVFYRHAIPTNTIIQLAESGCYDESIIFAMSSYQIVKPPFAFQRSRGNALQDLLPMLKYPYVTTRPLFNKRLEKLRNPKSMPTEWNNLIVQGDDDDDEKPFPAFGFDFENTRRAHRLTLFYAEWKPIRYSMSHARSRCLFIYDIFFLALFPSIQR